MLDRIKIKPDRLFLTHEAANNRTTVEGFRRSHYISGKTSDGSVNLGFIIGQYSPVKIHGVRLKDGRWWVGNVEAVLPALLNGHNGRPFKTAEQLWLALTVLVHIVKKVAGSEGHGRILPGLGSNNQGYIDQLECMIQPQDPDHAFLYGSHLGRMRHQRNPSGVYLGQSTRMSTREVAISVYDKDAQLRHGMIYPEGVCGTRIEAVVKDELRLAKDAKATTMYAGRPGEVVATINLDTVYGILRKNLMRVTGIGWMPDRATLASLCKNARIIAGTLGDSVRDPRRVPLALAEYRTSCTPSPNTYREVERDLLAYALRTVVPDPLAIVPANPADILWSEVHWAEREHEWAILMRDIGAPTEPDPAIVAAWSQTTFLSAKPLPEELIGSVMPSPAPFLTTTL